LFDLILNGSKDPMKQMWAHKTRFKLPQKGIKINLKPTTRSKRNRIKEKHKKGGHLQI
jgi:hypothetical protein